MKYDNEEAKKETTRLISEQQKLKALKENSEVQELFEYQLKVVAQKMVFAFTPGANGDNVQSWDDFCKIRGEIVARLEPMQTIYGSEAVIEYLTSQLKDLFQKEV